MKTSIAAVTLLAAITFSVNADEGIALGYVTGNKYMKLSDNERSTWLIGVLDGLMAEDLMLRDDMKGPWVGRCIKGLPTSQIKAVFEKELLAKPESWHAPAAVIFRARMEQFCKGRI